MALIKPGLYVNNAKNKPEEQCCYQSIAVMVESFLHVRQEAEHHEHEVQVEHSRTGVTNPVTQGHQVAPRDLMSCLQACSNISTTW